MKLFTLFLFVFSFYSLICAEDVKLKDGRIYKNVSLSDSTDQYYVFKSYPAGKTIVARDNIKEIVWSPVEPSIKTTIIGSENYRPDIPKTLYLANDTTGVRYKQNNSIVGKINLAAYMLPTSAALLFVGISFLGDASDIDDQIKSLPSYLDKGSLEKQRGRKQTAGIICIGAGVIGAVLSFIPVEVEANFNSANLKYRF